MCRSIQPLYNVTPPATEDEVYAAAMKYVRKISGFPRPSKANEAAFRAAVDVVAAASRDLLAALVTPAPPRDRAVRAERARSQRAARAR
jgi:hypothetical protein